MSRYCGDRDSKATLDAAEHWRQNCLLKDGSVFTSKSLWQLNYLMDLDKYFINRPDGSKSSFYEKFSGQLAPTAPEVKQLAAEILWVMFLCPSNISTDTKREGIFTVWNWSGEKLPADVHWLKDNYLNGVGSSGTGYNTNRWREVVFAIRVIIAIKRLTSAEREEILNDGWAMGKWLEKIPECDSRQFRHMILFLLFPDNFERIFGGTHRKMIISSLTDKTSEQVNNLTVLEADSELFAIRKKHEKKYGLKELDFYVPPLKDLWGDNKNITWLMTWNPSNWEWDTLQKDRLATHQGRSVRIPWSCSNKNAKVRDKVFLSRTGVEPKGIIATGKIIKAPYKAKHWDKSKEDKTCSYVDVSFTLIQDPLQGDKYVTIDDLKKITIDKQDWSPKKSGIEIKNQSAGILNKLWDKIIPPKIDPISPRLDIPVNLILYGPPGTGKTYALRNEYMRRFTENLVVTRDQFAQELAGGLTWLQVITIVLYDLGPSKVSGIFDHPLLQAKIHLSANQTPKNTIWGWLQRHTRDDCINVKFSQRSEPQLFTKDEHSVWSVDSELVDEQLPELIDKLKAYREFNPKPMEFRRYEFITFHQSYSYEDFVEGIKPIMSEDLAVTLTYEVKPGIFKNIVKRALDDPDHEYALLIDEINRGNVASIFGELIALIEDDKRKGAPNELRAELPYSREEFTVPGNLYIIGAMNTADRSVEALDTALRRRFSFVPVLPDPMRIEQSNILEVDLHKLLITINARIEKLLDKDHCIGHSYFMSIAQKTDPLKELCKVFSTKIFPLLEEYFYGDPGKIGMILGERFVTRKDDMIEWAAGDWGMAEYEERRVYALQNPMTMNAEDFRSVYE